MMDFCPLEELRNGRKTIQSLHFRMKILAGVVGIGLWLLPTCLADPPPDAGTAVSSANGPLSVTPNDIIVRVHGLIATKEYKLAEEILNDLMNRPGVIRPVVAEAVYLQGRIALMTDQQAKAIVWFRRYIDNYADQANAPYVNFLLGQVYKETGAYDRARENFYKTLSFTVNKAASLTQEDYDSSVRLTQAASWELAETEYLSNNWARADELYTRFKRQNPSLDTLINTANYRLADCSYQLGKSIDAISRYESALAESPFHPFATEAWLRLISLYGAAGDKKKEIDATHSFIWLVNTLQEDDKMYWQRRCADMLLSQYKDDPEKQIPILETILSTDKSESWMKMLDFYLSLLNRQLPEEQGKQLPAPSDKSRDDWQGWLSGFSKRLNDLRQQFDKINANNNSSNPADPGAMAPPPASP
jgi:TolA-binding protein